MIPIKTSLGFDMRAPDFGTPRDRLYAAALDMAAFADEIGVSRVNLTEHHGSDDGYLPTPFVLGGGVAARTKRCGLSLGAVILPLHDPVKIAEQIAVLDIMSNGRLEIIFGAGYVASEFALFNVSLRDRAKLLDSGVDIILRSLRGEKFQSGEREIYVRPLPLQRPENIVFVGGGVEASAKRAAKFGTGFAPVRADLVPIYEDECRRLGREPGISHAPGKLGAVHLTEDPDRTWAQVLPHVHHVVTEYAKWAEQEPNSNSPYRGLLGNDHALRNCGVFNVLTPDELVARIPDAIGPNASLGFSPLIGGLAPELGWESLELLKKTLPRLVRP